MQILGLLGMYFDAVVVKVKTFFLLFRLALAILCNSCALPLQLAELQDQGYRNGIILWITDRKK